MAAPLQRLKCPGGPRMTSLDIKHLFRATTSRQLSKLGLRFLLNLKLTHILMKHLNNGGSAGSKLFLELGPGPGSLTRSLLSQQCAGVVGIELDTRFNPLLQQISEHTRGKFKWLNGDVLQLNEADVIADLFPDFAERFTRRRESSNNSTKPLMSDKFQQMDDERRRKRRPVAEMTSSNSENVTANGWWSVGEAPLEVVANLPFSVSPELIMRYAVDCSKKEGIFKFGRVPVHMFFQQDVAQRITAAPGTPHFGRPSVLLQNFFRVKICRVFRETTYFPKTEVLGALVTFEPRSVPLVDVGAAALIAFTDILLGKKMRHKAVEKGLKTCMPSEVASYVLAEVGVDASMNPLQLTITEIAKMALLWERFLEATTSTCSASSSSTDGRDDKENGKETCADGSSGRDRPIGSALDAHDFTADEYFNPARQPRKWQ